MTFSRPHRAVGGKCFRVEKPFEIFLLSAKSANELFWQKKSVVSFCRIKGGLRVSLKNINHYIRVCGSNLYYLCVSFVAALLDQFNSRNYNRQHISKKQIYARCLIICLI